MLCDVFSFGQNAAIHYLSPIPFKAAILCGHFVVLKEQFVSCI